MDIHIDLLNDTIDIKKIKKALFILNAINNHWEVRKKNDKYIFKKKNTCEKLIYSENYIEDFIKKNI